MKKFFYIGAGGMLLFEILRVYFIMPFPGSQGLDSIDLAYFLNRWQWIFRVLFLVLILLGIRTVFSSQVWKPILMLLILGVIIYMANLVMSADKMFKQPNTLSLLPATANKVDLERLVLGISINGEAKAYPIQFIAYHHQVRDTVGGKPVMVTYCSVCRSGRVFAPEVKGEPETFRLVGMNHFNAMFEDQSTKSWWRQATGEAVTGKLKGEKLPEIQSTQTTLGQWLELYPHSLVMQSDPDFADNYAGLDSFELGKGSFLTKSDTGSWQFKSWVVGLHIDTSSAVFDWNRLKKQKVINDKVGDIPVLVVLASDGKSFFAYERPSPQMIFTISNDTLIAGEDKFDLTGKAINPAASIKQLKPVNAYQEFWHSWKQFN